MTGKFTYEASALDLNAYVKNLKTNTVELTEKVYVDKPFRKQKELPIENQHAIASTFNQNRDLRLTKNSQSIQEEDTFYLSREGAMSLAVVVPKLG